MQITVTAKTYDEAITEALLELQTTSDHLDVTVIEEGKEGLLGVIGSKMWKIRAQALTDEQLQEKKKKAKEEESAKKDSVLSENESVCPAAKPATVKEKKDIDLKTVKQSVKTSPMKPIVLEEVAPIIENTVIEDLEIEVQDVPHSEKIDRELKPVSEEEAAVLREKAVTFLNDTFKIMDIEADIETSFDHSENELDVVISGDDMGILIGKRGQTLDSLQYLTSLVVNKHHDGYIRVKLDTENYRERRQVKLEELAHNIAHKVARSKKSVDLEPMNPYERRIIHSALQDDPYVTTVSEGEEPYRHVVVLLKKPNRRKRH